MRMRRWPCSGACAARHSATSSRWRTRSLPRWRGPTGSRSRGLVRIGTVFRKLMFERAHFHVALTREITMAHLGWQPLACVVAHEFLRSWFQDVGHSAGALACCPNVGACSAVMHCYASTPTSCAACQARVLPCCTRPSTAGSRSGRRRRFCSTRRSVRRDLAPTLRLVLPGSCTTCITPLVSESDMVSYLPRGKPPSIALGHAPVSLLAWKALRGGCALCHDRVPGIREHIGSLMGAVGQGSGLLRTRLTRYTLPYALPMHDLRAHC